MSLAENSPGRDVPSPDSGIDHRESSSEDIKEKDSEFARPTVAPALTFPEGGLDGWLAVTGGYVLTLNRPCLVETSGLTETRF